MNASDHNTPSPTQLFAKIDVREPENYRLRIMVALKAIEVKVGARYPERRVYQHLKDRLQQRGSATALWLWLDHTELEAGAALPDAVCGLMTLDVGEDEVAMPVAMITRAWCKPGCGIGIWETAGPEIDAWARERSCVAVVFQTKRESAFAPILGGDGFVMQETQYEKRFDTGRDACATDQEGLIPRQARDDSRGYVRVRRGK